MKKLPPICSTRSPYADKSTLLRGRLHMQRGLTLVELLVAITLMLLVTMATAALFMVTGQGSRTVDSALQMDDTARFAFKIMENAVQNAGYTTMVPTSEDSTGRVVKYLDDCATSASTMPCPVLGFDNAKISTTTSSGTDSTDFGTKDSAAAAANNSDSLALRFYGSGETTAGDGNIITCTGQSVPAPTAAHELGLSIFWVDADTATDNEPSLKCTNQGYSSEAPAGIKRSTQTLVRGVEVFQVMYGLDLCKPNASATKPLEDCSVAGQDGIIDRWVSAKDVGNANWRAVKAVRIGMVLRGGPNSAQASDGNDLYPLGKDFVGTLGGTETGLKFTPPNDGRMRRVYTSVLMLRNSPI